MSNSLPTLLAGALIAGLAGSTFYFYTEAQEQETHPPSFGQLSAVNRVILAEQDYTDQCEVFDDQGVGEGLVLFDWSFLFAFGVDIPPDWEWNVVQSEDGTALIDLPALEQLSPHYVEFTSTREIDPANGNRWQRMIRVAIRNAHERIDRAEQVMLESNENIHETAQASARVFFLPILQSLETETPITDVVVRFADDTQPSNLEFISAIRCE
ncbi:hypothetical protein E2K80_08200 [Rhodophyticola sp. CCM32]|uniref:hypothetical protein n=1 Tax=Rhodophyticola sp. CCM32 TaxID=2916397 RepID=UPI00107F4A2F|nr:hypothetical protein [Rhodophyticola sp. CCM32]QBY00716.1 hypothetical protein E2K80_08200 [Rhodophyticola sp. CCM32]